MGAFGCYREIFAFVCVWKAFVGTKHWREFVLLKHALEKVNDPLSQDFPHSHFSRRALGLCTCTSESFKHLQWYKNISYVYICVLYICNNDVQLLYMKLFLLLWVFDSRYFEIQFWVLCHYFLSSLINKWHGKNY